MFHAMASLVLASLVSLGPRDITTGRVQVLRHDDPTNEYAEICRAVLISRDTVLLRASCFERNLTNGKVDLSKLDATFFFDESQGEKEFSTGTIAAVDLHPDFQSVDCSQSSFSDICAQARLFCMQRATGLPKTRCLARPEFFARTKLFGKNIDLALAYINGSSQRPTTAIAQGADLRSSHDGFVSAVQLDDVVLSQPVLSSTPYNFRLPYTESMWSAPVGLAFVTSPSSQHGLIALPSRLAELAGNPADDLMLEYSRVDTPEILTWITQQMSDAVASGKRADTSGLTFLDVSAPAPPDPDPAPVPQPPPDTKPPVDPPEQPAPTPAPLPPAPPDTAPAPQEPLPPPPTDTAPGPHGIPTEFHVPRTVDLLPPKGGCGGDGLQEWSLLLLLPAFARRRRCDR